MVRSPSACPPCRLFSLPSHAHTTSVVQDAEQRMEQLERQLGKQFDPASRPRPAPGPTSRGAPAKVKLEPWSKRLEGKERASLTLSRRSL